jgi:hypothetical protein
VVTETAGTDRASLFNVELNSCDCERALRVVDIYHRFGGFLGCVDILFVSGPHLGDSLVDTAPSGDLTFFRLLFVHLESYWGLPDRQYLLVLHCIFFMFCVNSSFDVVLYFGLGAFTDRCIFKVN